MPKYSIRNIILVGETLKAFPLRSRMRQKHPPPSFLLNIVLELLVSEIRTEKEKRKKERKYMRIGKEQTEFLAGS